MPIEILEIQRLGKTVYAVIEPDKETATIRVDCLIYGMAEFEIPVEAAREIFGGERRRQIQEILPDYLTPEDWRGIFLSGLTPAEFDRDFDRPIKTREEYGCYPPAEES